MITASEVKKQLALGEDSANQFKEGFSSIDKLASEICAFANTRGGRIIIGADDTGKITGVSAEVISRLNQWISTVTPKAVTFFYKVKKVDSLGRCISRVAYPG